MYTWKMQLRDRKGYAISALVGIGPEEFTGDGSPPKDGTNNPVIARYYRG